MNYLTKLRNVARGLTVPQLVLLIVFAEFLAEKS